MNIDLAQLHIEDNESNVYFKLDTRYIIALSMMTYYQSPTPLQLYRYKSMTNSNAYILQLPIERESC